MNVGIGVRKIKGGNEKGKGTRMESLRSAADIFQEIDARRGGEEGEGFWPLVNFENLKIGGGDILGVWESFL